MAGEEDLDADLFKEPEDWAPTPPPTKESYLLQSGQSLTINLVGYNLLEGHFVWNGSRLVSRYFEDNAKVVRGLTVLELGAGGGLPSLMAAALGARKVVVTDYPDNALIDNLRKNIGEATGVIPEPVGERIVAEGYAWGRDATHVLAHLATTPASSSSPSSSSSSSVAAKFDVLVLADLLFKHPQHANMVTSVELTLRRGEGARALVFFTSYRPWLRDKDLAFFDLARGRGFVVEKIMEVRLEKPMFVGDPGDLEVQKTVTGWSLAWPESEWTE